MSPRKTFIGAATIVVLIAAAWLLGFFGGSDPAVAELQQMADQAFDDRIPEDQRDQLRDQIRQRIGALTPQQREAFFEASRGQWTMRAEQRMDQFFAMTPAEQQKRLDEMLNRMAQRENRPRGENGGNGAERRGRGNWANMTESQRDERSKRRLDQTSPKMRAQMSEFRKRLADRAKERGITPPGGWGPRGNRS